MNLALIQNSAYQDYSECSSFALIVDLAKFKKSGDYIPEGEIEEFEWSLKEFHTKELVDAVVISSKLFDEEENIASESEFDRSALALATHIRLTKGFVGYLPIIILSFKSFEDIVRDSFRFPNILKTRGLSIIDPHLLSLEPVKTWYVPSEENFFDSAAESTKHKLKTIEEAIGEINKEAVEKDYRNILDVLQITSNKTSDNQHGVANEWGAYRLAQVAGIDMAAFNYPKTLYFKYLLAYQNEESLIVSGCQPFWSKNLNVLYIDDNEQKGWSKCLKQLFDKKIVSRRNTTIISRNTWDNTLEGDLKDDKFDLIFLDYYLTNGEKGDQILTTIKALNPVVPVIMFTASNKAWNMDKLYETGADGYYVKEHPQTAKNWSFSVENFNEFHKTVQKCLEKGGKLRPFWRKIKDIKNKSILTNRSGEMVKERIDERLYMFLGLLKKSFEETFFDKNTFFYSDIELAFLTLWSVLNEIQHTLYERTQPNITVFDSSGRSYSNHSGSKSHINISYLNLQYVKHYKWQYKGNTFLEYDYRLKETPRGPEIRNDKYVIEGKQKTYIVFNNGSYTFPSVCVESKPDLQKILHVQIAFILHKMSCPTQYLTWLKDLNDIRNRLYLTHGEDSSTNYGDEIKNLRVLNLDLSCQQLFKIVYFLTTGSECVW